MGKKYTMEDMIAQFPHLKDLDWEKAFRQDTELYANIWHDILKVDQAEPGRSGPRPSLVDDKGNPLPGVITRFRQLNDDDFSMVPFHEALRLLAGNMSVRKIADKTGLDRNLIQRLLAGRPPDNYEMEIIATAFKKRPSYFLEYRIAYTFALLYEHMVKYPESSVKPYLRVRDKFGQKAVP